MSFSQVIHFASLCAGLCFFETDDLTTVPNRKEFAFAVIAVIAVIQ
jgi:hypothetical protein